MNRNRAIVSAAATAVFAAALVACGGSDGGSDGSPFGPGDRAARPSSSTAAPTSEEQQTPHAPPASTTPPGANIGDTLSLIGANGFGGSDSDEADVTVLKYNDNAKPSLDVFAAPDGQRLVAAQFTILSTGQATYDDPGNIGAKAVDSKGTSYLAKPGDPTDGESLPLVINLPPGDKTTGWVLFSVPKDAKIVAITYQMDPILQNHGEHTARWNLPT